jgi:4-hydroxy 2-oxovalerate aldolase
VISVNYVPKDTLVQAIFLTNSKRYTELMNTLDESVNKDVAIIATSNVYKTNGAFTYVLNYENLIDKDTEIADNSLVMLLKAMINFKVKKVFLAGFDGYSKRRDNYFEISREYSYVKEKADYLNTYVREFLEKNRKKIDAQFITRSHYNKKEKKDEK